MSPFVFFMEEFAHNKFYVTYRLEPMDHKTKASPEFRRPEYFKGSYMHENVPVFISPSNKQLIYFTPNPEWYVSAIQQKHYQSAIEFITLLGDNADDRSEQFKKAAYTLGAMDNIMKFYQKEDERTVEAVINLVNDFKMGGISPKNILVFLVLFIFKDCIPDLYNLFQEWFSTSLESWKKDIIKSCPPTLVKTIQESVETVLNEKAIAVKKSGGKPLKTKFSEDANRGVVIQSIMTYLLAVKSQIVDEAISAESVEQRELFYTSLVVIVYYQSPSSKEMMDLFTNTKYLLKSVVLTMLEKPTKVNSRLLVEYYISQNHVDGIFTTPGISYIDKRGALMRILQKNDVKDSSKIISRIKDLIIEKMKSSGGMGFIDDVNNSVESELFLIFGKNASKLTPEEVCTMIENWSFTPHEDIVPEELCHRLSTLYAKVVYKNNNDNVTFATLFIRKAIEYLNIAALYNIKVTDPFMFSFVEVIKKFPDIAKTINETTITPYYYKARAAIANAKKQNLLPVLINIIHDLQMNGIQVFDEFYEYSVPSLLSFLVSLYNQKKFIQSVNTESVLPLMYSTTVRKVIQDEYVPLVTVDNILAEITLLIFTSESPKETYEYVHTTVVSQHAPGQVLQFIWDLADPKEFPIPHELDAIENELKQYDTDNDIQCVLEGVIGYLEKKTENKGTTLTDCYLQYLKVAKVDRVDVTTKLMEQMANNPALQRHIATYYDSLPWRLRCRIQHTNCKYLGLLEHFKQMKLEYSPSFVQDTFEQLDEFLRVLDPTYVFDGSSGAIAKCIRIIRQKYRPFNKTHPSHIGAEVIMYCVCQVNNLKVNTSPLLSLLIHMLLERDNQSFDNPFPPSFALELFSRFYPIIPLRFTASELKWLGINLSNFDLGIDVGECIFTKMLEGVECFADIRPLLPAIYASARKYFYESITLGAIKTLTSNCTKRYEIMDGRTTCCKCHHYITASQPFTSLGAGTYAHEQCMD